METVVVDRVNFSNEKQNYIKAQLALDCTRTGLKEFVQGGINTLHQTIMQTLSKRTPCTACSITNVVKCPIKGVCKGRPCEMHKVDPYRLCPTAFCDSFMPEINRSYRPHVPTWQNTVTQRWSTDPWQIAKCFLPTGYEKCTSADDTDLPGLIHIITNCIAFQAQITENLGASGNIFHQVRDSRNAINHSASMEMTDAELAGHIDRMIDILEDTTYLQSHGPAMESVRKLKKLKTDPLLMSREEEKQMRKTAREKYDLDKKRLQSHLAEQYLILYSKISLSPLVSGIVADFDDVSVPQTMQQVGLSHETTFEALQQNLPYVKSFKDIFTRKSQTCKHIYIKGEPGVGKTFLSQRIALSWAKFIKGELVEEDEEFIKHFSILFYISLRYVHTTTNMDDMILDHPLLQCEEYKDLITRILRDESETCLIVLDGLDEWSSPHPIATTGISKGLPHRDVTRRSTILTTTRPWKMEVIRMAPTEIDQLVELTGMDGMSSKKYIGSLVSCLNQKFGRDMDAEDFEQMLRNNKLYSFRTLPVLLKYLVCVWHAGRSIGSSQCEIYSGMLDLLLQLPGKESACRNEALESLKQTSQTVNLPSCFNGKFNCQLFGCLLQRLSKLAFQTLFAENQEPSLVFDSSCAEIHGMSKTDIQACLNIGILSQDIVMEQCATPEMSLSFLHKTFQEFLAAVYVYTFPDQTDSICTTVSKFCNSVERVLELSKEFMFISGMCPAIISRLSEHIAGVVSGDETVQMYRKEIVYRHSALCDIVQNMMVDCIKEAHCAGLSQDLDIYIQDIIIYKNRSEHVQQLIHSSCGHIKSILTWDNQNLSQSQHIVQSGTAEKLAVLGDDYDPVPLSLLSGIIHQNRNSIKCLNLDHISCTDMPLETLSQLIEGVVHLEAIGIKWTTLRNEQYAWLLSYLSRKTGLKQIGLSLIKCEENPFVGHSHSAGLRQTMSWIQGSATVTKSGHTPLDLTSHNQLTTLQLSDLPTDHNILLPISPSLTTLDLAWLYTDRIGLPTNLTHLQTCRLHSIKARGVVASVLQALRYSSHLQKLDVWPSVEGMNEATDAVIDVLPTLHYVKHITLGALKLNIVGRELKLSHLMTHLEHVRLCFVTLSRETLSSTVASILAIPHPLKVELRYITITPNDDTDIALDYIRSSSRCVVTLDEKDMTVHRTIMIFRTTVPMA